MKYQENSLDNFQMDLKKTSFTSKSITKIIGKLPENLISTSISTQINPLLC